MSSSSRLLPLLTFVLVGCSLTNAPEVDPKTNECSADTDCGDGATCVLAASKNRVCASKSSELGSVILEVQLTGGTQASYLFLDTFSFDGTSDTGQAKSVDITLPAPVSVTGAIHAPQVDTKCRAGDTSVPANVTFHRRSHGGPLRYEVAAIGTSAIEGLDTAAYSLSVPPGAYDVYFEPKIIPGCEATPPAPPQLMTDVRVEGESLVIEPPEEALASLTGTVLVPAAASLEGWVLEIVDPVYGHVISDRLMLLGAEQGQITIGDNELRYHAIANPLLRLRDPEGDLSVHWVLAALDLDLDDHIEIDLGDLVAEPMPIQATIIDANGALVPSGNVVIQSLALTGSANQNASFRVSTTSDENGVITVNLVPGTYVVTIVPETTGAAPYIGTWEITDDAGGSGRGFELATQPVIRGVVQDSSGDVLAAAPVFVSPVRAVQNDYFSQVLSKPDPALQSSWPTRPQAVSSTPDGSFELAVDPGRVNLLVQMPPDTGYPWFVLPSVLVGTAEDKPIVDLDALTIRYPVLAQGRITNALGVVPFAAVRAWVQPRDGDTLGPLVQIGATTTDEAGVFVLPLPPSITLPSTESVDSDPANAR